uniref:C3H1-type domain-containing protein n=1 Tax=Ganoderma boninense TaxID=34458 RepID=A0A5K1JZA3_9APHY|nr:C3H1-type domain-containing protein [Ganoderma boninense]
MHLTQQPATVVVEAAVAEAVEEAVERTLSSPEFAAEVTADIRNLGQTVKDIRKGFRAVADDLVAFDNDEYKDKNGEVLQLRPQWLGYQATFDDILEKSHRNALAAASMIRQYTEAILTDVDPSEFEDVQEELRGFLKKLDEKAPTAQETQGDLEKLVDDVRSFKTTIDETLWKAGNKCVSDVDEAKTHLQDVEKKLESINDDKKQLGILAVGGLLLGGACAIVAIFVLAPAAGKVVLDAVKKIGPVGAVYCGIQGWLLHRQGAECEIEMEECKVDIVNKKDRYRELRGHKAALTQTKEQITALAKKVDTISEIWRVCDMQQLQEQLALVVGPDMQVTRRFLKKLRRPREVYNRLADLLELYAKGNFERS